MLDVHMHKPLRSSRNFMDSLFAFWPGLQVGLYTCTRHMLWCVWCRCAPVLYPTCYVVSGAPVLYPTCDGVSGVGVHQCCCTLHAMVCLVWVCTSVVVPHMLWCVWCRCAPVLLYPTCYGVSGVGVHQCCCTPHAMVCLV